MTAANKPYDASTKVFMDAFADDWAPFIGELVGLTVGEDLKLAEADLSSVTKEADKVYDIGDDGLLHLEV